MPPAYQAINIACGVASVRDSDVRGSAGRRRRAEARTTLTMLAGAIGSGGAARHPRGSHLSALPDLALRAFREAGRFDPGLDAALGPLRAATVADGAKAVVACALIEAMNG
jgi:hypothetical protein